MRRRQTLKKKLGRVSLRILEGMGSKVGYVSDLYAGSTSDKEITRHCGLLELLNTGDAVMADKGFDIRYELMLIGIGLNIPPFAKKNTQMPARDVVSTR